MERPCATYPATADRAVDGPDPRGTCAVAATVTDVLPRGARALVLASTDGPEIRFEVDANEAEALARGSALTVSWDPDDALVFPECADARASALEDEPGHGG